MSNNSTKKWGMFIFAVVWLSLFGGGVLFYTKYWKPRSERIAAEQAAKEKEDIFAATSSKKRYKHEPKFNYDLFSGYAPLRSNTFLEIAGSYDIGPEYKDDGADSTERLQDLASGKANMSVFTIGALQKALYNHGDLPVTIVDIIDETKGADAMIGSKLIFKNLDALNDPNLRIVCMKDTPSETLARVVMSQFKLTKVSESNFDFVDSPEAVFEAWKNTSLNEKAVFIMWEPYVSRALQNENYRSIIDTSKFRGYIVDVVVANREYLVKNEQVVLNYVKSYRETLFKRRNDMEKLVMDDASKIGDPLTPEQAEQLVKGIWWKNTQEVYGHFGFTSGHGLQHIEEMIRNITDVLVKTGAIPKDPTNGQPNLIYYDGIIKRLHESNWHPGFGHEQIRREKTLLALTDTEWDSLIPVGTWKIENLTFRRGTSSLSRRSYGKLNDLAEKLNTWPQYYLIVEGKATKNGDVEANKQIASDRAQSAVDYLISKGIDKNRIRARVGQLGNSTSVEFILGEQSY